jgi:ABC-type transporter Mla subunit MlaD
MSNFLRNCIHLLLTPLYLFLLLALSSVMIFVLFIFWLFDIEGEPTKDDYYQRFDF